MNTPSQHTSGEWFVEVWDYPQASPPRKELVVRTKELLIATVAWDEGKDNPYTVKDETAKANACLLAASPTLLDELRDLEGFVTKFGDTYDRAAFMRAAEGYLVAARAAIAKATTPQP